MAETNRPHILPHILIVDDDARLRTLLKTYLHEQGFRVSAAENARSARECLQGLRFDMIILDVMMPGESGTDLAQSLRKRDVAPILMLSAMAELEDRIKGFRSGVDDYLCKPFDPEELVMRIQAILRRAAQRKEENTTPCHVRFGRYRFDPTTNILVKDGARLHLTNREKHLLNALARHVGEPVSRTILCREMGLSDTGRAVDIHVSRLRRRLGDGQGKTAHIRTVRGRGYQLNGRHTTA